MVDVVRYEDFIKDVCSDDKLWTHDADETIELDPGVGITCKLGYIGDMHTIIAGTTGSGKSVLVNELIATVARKYSPRDLELWLLDCKGTEFSFYIPTERHEEALPHIKCCVCSEKSLQILAALDRVKDEIDYRYRVLANNEAKNISEYNRSNEGHIPHALIFIEEFQAIYESASKEDITQFNAYLLYIFKYGRTCGIHLVLSTQRDSLDLPDGFVDLCTLRFILRCTKDVSEKLLGDDSASLLEQPFGNVYVKSMAQEGYALCETPFIPDTYLRDQIKSMAEKAKKENTLSLSRRDISQIHYR